MEEKKAAGKKQLAVIGAVVAAVAAIIIGMAVYQKSPAQQMSKLLDLGQKYLLEQEYEQAIAKFDEVLAIDPRNVDAYMGKAEAYVGLEDYASAAAMYEEVVAIDPENADAHMKAAGVYVVMENYSSAVDHYEKIIVIDGGNTAAYLGAGEVHVTTESYEDALDVLKRGYDATQDAEIEAKLAEVERLIAAKAEEEAEETAEAEETEEADGEENEAEAEENTESEEKKQEEAAEEQQEAPASSGNAMAMTKADHDRLLARAKNDSYRTWQVVSDSGIIMDSNGNPYFECKFAGQHDYGTVSIAVKGGYHPSSGKTRYDYYGKLNFTSEGEAAFRSQWTSFYNEEYDGFTNLVRPGGGTYSREEYVNEMVEMEVGRAVGPAEYSGIPMGVTEADYDTVCGIFGYFNPEG